MKTNNIKIDYTGQKFGKLTILKEGEGLYEGKVKRRSVVCKCDCGNEKEVLVRALKKGKQKSCGCLSSKPIKFKEGDKIGFWTVIEVDAQPYFSHKGGRMTTCKVECVCGKENIITKNSLKNGSSRSCGCRGVVRKEKIKREKIIPIGTQEEQWKQSINYPEYYISTLGRLFHYYSQNLIKPKTVHERDNKSSIHIKKEMYNTFVGEFDETYLKVYGDFNINSLYLHYIPSIKNTFRNRYKFMVSRCSNKNDTNYRSYGAKGIKIEKGFETFGLFLDWVMSQGIKGNEKLEIDRIDNSKGYSPENCRFITKDENMLRALNLSIKDVLFIRSELFDWSIHRNNYNCSDLTIKNIIKYKSFKNV